MIVVHTGGQRTEEWFAAKAGVPSASNADQVLTASGNLSSSATRYMCSLLAERRGIFENNVPETEWMIRGRELEDEARGYLAFDHDLEVVQVDWVLNDDESAGCSPDGLAELDGEPIGVEIKCPKASTHISYLLNGTLPTAYKPQVHWSLAVTGLPSWLFVSYYPGLDPLVVRVSRDRYTQKMLAAMQQFVEQLNVADARLGRST